MRYPHERQAEYTSGDDGARSESEEYIVFVTRRPVAKRRRIIGNAVSKTGESWRGVSKRIHSILEAKDRQMRRATKASRIERTQ